jgi:hypothetical protein
VFSVCLQVTAEELALATFIDPTVQISCAPEQSIRAATDPAPQGMRLDRLLFMLLEPVLTPMIENLRSLGPILTPMIENIRASPPSPGYEPWFIERGTHLVAAKGLAYLAVRGGRRLAAERAAAPKFAAAIKFLARPHGRKKAILRRVQVLLEVWESTSVFDPVFEKSGLDVIAFVQTLETFAAGQLDYAKLSAAAAAIVPYLPVCRGLRLSPASAAHELFLEYVRHLEPWRRGCTWNFNVRKFTDPVTEATRREFGLVQFDPRPALRRVRQRDPARHSGAAAARARPDQRHRDT